MENTKCVICGTENSRLISTFYDETLLKINMQLKEEKRPSLSLDGKNIYVVKCRKCGLVYINPRLGEDELRIFYEKLYPEIEDQKRIEPSTCFEESIEIKKPKIYQKQISEIEKFIDTNKKIRILDVGCATGFFLSEAKKKRWECYGVEISQKASDYARKKFCLNIFNGVLKNAKFQNNFFDVVTMYSVLEHMKNPVEVLIEINRILKNGGLLVFAVPNIDGIGYRIFDVKPFILEHLYYFSPSTVRLMLKKTEFIPLKITSQHYSPPPFPSVVEDSKKLISILSNKRIYQKSDYYEIEMKKQSLLKIINKQLLYYFLNCLIPITECNSIGGKLQLGNVLSVYAKKLK